MIEIFKKKNKSENEIQKKELNNLKDSSFDNANLNNINKDTDKTITVKVHTVNPNNLTGEVFGDYIVVDANDRDGSGHKLWRCVCPTCGDTFKTTSYELIKGRKKTVCKKCENTRFESTSTSASTDPNVTYSTYNPLDNNNNNFDCTAISSVNKYDENATFVYTTANGIKEEKYAQICSKVFVRDLNADLLSMPVYYNIAHCIPADFTVYGATAQRINDVYDLVDLIKHDYMDWEVRPNVGDVNYLKNVFTLFATPKKYARPSMEDLRKCVANLAQECVDLGIMHLAMPRIGCGHNKLKWDEVKDMICEEFEKVYTNMSNDTVDSRVIRITFCYQ